ncbi:MAG: hypothetical protein SFU87_12475 [Chitinophagaceae bacterium]|nr:hypothetical protein [Chitinophagaceae bacterium]
MKKILQAAAIMVMTASVVFAAARSRHVIRESCQREWNKSFQQTGNAVKKDIKSCFAPGSILYRQISLVK